jgi:hypothetical protein
MAGSWWAIGLRSAAAILFAIVVLWLPPQAVAPLVFLFAAYLIADGAFAILAGMRAPRWGSRWPMLILEGSVNLQRRQRSSSGSRLPPSRWFRSPPRGCHQWRAAACGGTQTFRERGSLDPRGGRGRVGRLGCFGGDPRRQRHADDGTVAGGLCADLWRDPRGPRRPLATRDNAPQLGAPPAARDGVNRSELCPAPASRMGKLDPMLQGWHGRCVRPPRCDTICGPPGR